MARTPKSRSGGQYAGKTAVQLGVAPVAPVAPAPDPADVVADDMTGQAGNLNTTLAQVQAMSDDELHDYILAVNDQDMPAFMNDHHMQKFVYATGVNDKPTVVDDATFDQIAKGKTVIYRTVDPTSDLSADDIHDMTKHSSLSYMGNGRFGDGIYFATNRGDSEVYASTRQAKVMRAVFNDKARVISIDDLRKDYDKWKLTHPKSQKALGFASRKGSSWANSYGQYALLRGYNVVTDGHTYRNVLDRSVLTISTSTRGVGKQW